MAPKPPVIYAHRMVTAEDAPRAGEGKSGESGDVSRRTFLGASAAAAAALVLAGCGRDESSAPTRSGDQPITKIRAGNLVGGCMSSLFLAHGMGFFRQEGLDVQLNYFGNAGDNLSSLVSDATQIIHNPFSNTFVGREKGEPLVIIAGSGKFGLEVMARGGSGIRSLDDLAARKGQGVKVGTARVNTQELTLFHLLKSKGMSYSDFQMVYFTDNLALGQALINKDVDVATVVQPYAAQVVAQADGVYLGTNETAWGPEAPDCMVTVKEPLLDAKPDWLVRYLRALLAAEDSFSSDPAAAVKVLGDGKYFKVEGKALDEGVRRQPPQVRLPAAALAALDTGLGDMRDLEYLKSVKSSEVIKLSMLQSVS